MELPQTERTPLKGRWVQFTVRDIYFPGLDAVLEELHGGDSLAGEIVDVSDSGSSPNAFVVVKVKGLERPVVVAASRVHDVSETRDAFGGQGG